ncbi:hypothetical protein FHR81_001888 [Actinoalloteichus hoggarensis]|uniref:Uncharacterized protein n=1 Tax=Actinoalloteichus hoggarensis TaxID=1470176 RepID=A0A221W4U4_9PSEU|nr:DUF2306 domain-containing protein [Actinoalloteichus hoggarensis]ASO20920.1 hypothetical protein AHOG_16470 [Actinoalloteichus hoggarensis]MBB5920850.1 hypothetical protein [Actinoalloteichus hoggarensis]
MTQHEERTGASSGGSPAMGSREVAAGGTASRPRWWRRPWVVPLVVVVLAFLAIAWPPYLTLDPARSLIVIREDSAVHYPLLVSHIVFGTVALVTVCLQLWPALRRRRPAVHRWSGRLYVFAGALPSAVIAMVITPLSPAPSVGTTLGGVFWLVTTTMGFIRARQRRYRQHRRWMLFSFAFAINIVWGRVFMIVLTMFGIDDPAVFAQIGLTAPWLGWVINVFLVQWWLNRTERREAAPQRPVESS